MTAEQQISKMFTAARVFAILSVISAHVTIRNSKIIANLYSAIGSIGVIVFFIAAGFYFKRETFVTFVRKKAKNILLPWIVLGSAVYVVNSVLNRSAIKIGDWGLWLIGYKTYLYFIPVLVICFLLFYFHNYISLGVAIALNALSLLFTSLGELEPIIEALHITNYLNVFNWIGFFSFGILLRRIPFEKCFAFFKRTRILALCTSVLCVVLVAFTGYKVGYFSPLGWAFELICAWGIFGLCTYSWTHGRVMKCVAEMSYAIYILHMMFVGGLAKLYALHSGISLFANVIVLTFTYLALAAGRYLAGRFKFETGYNLLLGIRQGQ